MFKIKSYRYCFVPLCTNTSKKTPEKMFFNVPQNPKRRNQWFQAVGRPNPKTSSHLFCCEDHFDLPNDMENYMQYHVMGSVPQVRMKPGCIPRKFECQKDRQKRTSTITKRSYIIKKQRATTIAECFNELKKTAADKTVTDASVSFENVTSNRVTADLPSNTCETSPLDGMIEVKSEPYDWSSNAETAHGMIETEENNFKVEVDEGNLSSEVPSGVNGWETNQFEGTIEVKPEPFDWSTALEKNEDTVESEESHCKVEVVEKWEKEYILKGCEDFDALDHIFGGKRNNNPMHNHESETKETTEPIEASDDFADSGGSTPTRKRKNSNSCVSFLAEVQMEKTEYLKEKLQHTISNTERTLKIEEDKLKIEEKKIALEAKKFEEDCRLRLMEIEGNLALNKMRLEKEMELKRLELRFKYNKE